MNRSAVCVADHRATLVSVRPAARPAAITSFSVGFAPPLRKTIYRSYSEFAVWKRLAKDGNPQATAIANTATG